MHQEALKLREGLLVGFFLAGLVVLGSLQAYWLKPIIQDAKVFEGEGICPLGLFLGALMPTGVAIVFFWLLH